MHIVNMISIHDCAAYAHFEVKSNRFFLVSMRTPQFIFVEFILLC